MSAVARVVTQRCRALSRLGADFETEWARSAPARALRAALVQGPLRIGVRALTRPQVIGLDRLDDLRRRRDVPAVIFAPNHHSHLDTPLMITVVPAPWRQRLIVAAAADYFFDRPAKGIATALVLNALPVDREATGRKSSDRLRSLLAEGWSLVMYPEGGRSPDGWGQPFKGGAAYLSSREGLPVVPVFIDGTGAILGKGMARVRRGRATVVFGSPLQPAEGESTRRYSARIEAAVAGLGDELASDWWSARQRAAAGVTPTLAGPAAGTWRRRWELTARRARRDGTGGRERSWPDLG